MRLAIVPLCLKEKELMPAGLCDELFGMGTVHAES